MKHYITHFSLTILLLLFIPGGNNLHAAGTYAEGWVVFKKLIKFESGGLIFESWEGEALINGYNKSEKCRHKDYTCYSPVAKKLKFSVRKENAKVVNFLRRQKGAGGFLVQYKIHRIEPVALSQGFEVIGIFEKIPEPPPNLPTKKIVRKTGSRNFSLKGEVVELDYRGTSVGTYEGLYIDHNTGKVHPFSVTDESMAKYLWQAMKSTKPFYIGVSVAIITGMRKSDHDIFEINYLEDAGGVQEKPDK